MTAPERVISVGGCVFPCERLLGRAEWAPLWDDAALRAGIGPTLITGGAGSIGSALAARLARADVPVCIADTDERAMDALARELAPSDTVHYRLCDVADALQLRDTVEAFQPQTVFHLAAKKHVKYAETAARNAITTNVLGTWHALDSARAVSSVKNVVCASSDKAVAATNLLGHTKRAAERLTTAFAATWTRGNIASVRLCNVLGTAGNVLDHYVDEAKRGVVLDVWSRDMTRYFCSVYEAVDLFLHAAMHRGAPVITLDPGAATAIADLAERVCAILGEHGVDARFEVSERFAPVHARHEELWTDDESVSRPAAVPDVAAIQYAPATLEAVETIAGEASGTPMGNAAMLAWLERLAVALR